MTLLTDRDDPRCAANPSQRTVLEAATKGRVIYRLVHASVGWEHAFATKARFREREAWGVLVEHIMGDLPNGRWYSTEAEARAKYNQLTREKAR